MQRIEVILSDNSLIYEALGIDTDVLRYVINTSTDISNFLMKHGKIDILILDNINSQIDITSLSDIANYLIAVDDNVTTAVYARLLKPFRLNSLLESMSYHYISAGVFCSIDKLVIYDEAARALRYRNSITKLTDKENKIIHAIITADNFTVNKDELFNKIWQYATDAETSTIDTYLSRLRSKLPQQLLTTQNGVITLNASCVE